MPAQTALLPWAPPWLRASGRPRHPVAWCVAGAPWPGLTREGVGDVEGVEGVEGAEGVEGVEGVGGAEGAKGVGGVRVRERKVWRVQG